MHSVRKIVGLSSDYLGKKGATAPRREAEELLAALLGMKRLDLYLDYDQPLEDKQVDVYREWIRRKGAGEPIAYIIGEVEFLGCRIKVTPDVLIPRQETEVLVNLALEELKGEVIWDVCTGSGCIGLAVKKRFPDRAVCLSDLSGEALAIAKENAARCQLDVSFLEGDLLTPFSGEKADAIFCNPPYISEEEYAALESEVRDFEPKLALVGAEEGYDFYSRLSHELPQFLKPGGQVFLEIGSLQAPKIREMFNTSHWTKVECKKDWAGHDRFFFLEFES